MRDLTSNSDTREPNGANSVFRCDLLHGYLQPLKCERPLDTLKLQLRIPISSQNEIGCRDVWR